MGILDKIKGLLKGNKSAVTQGVDKASGLIAGKVGAEHASKVVARPVLAGGFDLVEAALVGVLDAEEEDVVGPTQDKWAGRERLRSQ